jgi:uncharacterized coiled-coil DUF342 family protein
MPKRRTPPSLVSMWMLDVFCCALGCVTLLWLLNTREAKNESTRAQLALTDLASTRDNLAAAKSDLDATRRQLNATIDELRGRIVATTTERDETAKILAATQADLAKSLAKAVLLDDDLKAKQKDAAALTGKLDASLTTLDELKGLLKKSETDRDALVAKSNQLDAKLSDADGKMRIALQDRDTATKTLAEMKKSGDELSQANSKIRDLANKLDNANTQLIDLQGDKKKLADKFDKLRVDSESKFAGIALTGKRVVFLVDISGSMKLTDERTPNPKKWPIVIETVAKVMRSLPDLESFQIITFSSQASFRFEGGFQKYLGEESITKVTDTLKKIEPVGDTNLYSGLDQAFKLRSSGLDTVYFFSDGLPTSGPGLSVEQAKLPDVQRSEILGKYIRETLARDWNFGTANGTRVRIHTIGFFYESPDVGAFLWALARENDGSFVGMSRP